MSDELEQKIERLLARTMVAIIVAMFGIVGSVAAVAYYAATVEGRVARMELRAENIDKNIETMAYTVSGFDVAQTRIDYLDAEIKELKRKIEGGG